MKALRIARTGPGPATRSSSASSALSYSSAASSRIRAKGLGSSSSPWSGGRCSSAGSYKALTQRSRIPHAFVYPQQFQLDDILQLERPGPGSSRVAARAVNKASLMASRYVIRQEIAGWLKEVTRLVADIARRTSHKRTRYDRSAAYGYHFLQVKRASFAHIDRQTLPPGRCESKAVCPQ